MTNISNYNYFNNLLVEMSKGKDLTFKYYYLIGARKSGKTYSVINFVLNCLRTQQSIKILCIRETFELAKETWLDIWDLLRMSVDENKYNYYSTFRNETRLEIKVNNFFLQIKALATGSKARQKLKGLRGTKQYTYGLLHIEEADNITREQYISAVEAFRGYTYGIEIGTANPYLATHWFIKRALLKLPQNEFKIREEHQQLSYDKNSKTIIHYMSVYINNFLARDVLQSLVKMNEIDKVRGRVSLYGLVGQLANGVYTSYLDKIGRVPHNYVPYLFGIGVDYGMKKDAYACVFSTCDKGGEYLCIEDMWYWNNGISGSMNPSTAAMKIMIWVKRLVKSYIKDEMTTIYMYVDCSMPPFATLLQKEAEELGISSYVKIGLSAKPRIKERIAYQHTLMSMRKLRINSDKCSVLWRELEGAKWSDKNVPERQDGNDDAINAMEYSFDGIAYNVNIEGVFYDK